MTRGAFRLRLPAGGARVGAGGLVALLGCRPVGIAPRVLEADPDAPYDAAATDASRLVPDPARGGPAIVPDASPLPPFAGVSRATAAYVGATACSGCHAEAAAAWIASPHARAWNGLEAAGASHRSDCIGCHATGHLQPTGYGDGAASLVDVQCEACHGPGSDHASSGREAYGGLPRSMAACVACHTWATSPDFAFPAAWARIAH